VVTGYLNLFQLRGLGIYPYNSYTIEVGTGGLRVETLEMPYQNNPNTANAVAAYLQSVSSDNALRACRVKFHANKSAELMTAAMTGQISTRWTIQETQTGIDGDYFINGRKRTISLGNRLDVEWLMVPAGTEALWILDNNVETTNQVIDAGSADCDGNDNGGFSNTKTTLEIGNISAGDWPAKAWIPFIVEIDQGTPILSANLKLISSELGLWGTVKVKIGCEAADNPSAPSSWATLNSRVLTSAYTTVDGMPAWNAGVGCVYDVTAAIQEIINRGGFANGNTIAVMIVDNGSTPDAARKFASSEHGSYAGPVLEIIV
jgi:hypothetical protein